MAQIRPQIRLLYGRTQEPVRVPLSDLLLAPTAQTVLTSDTASASGTLTVKEITGFAINQILLIGDVGNQGAEIIKTHASTAPSGSTITLASTTTQPHSANTIITVLNYDQVEISQAATLTGSKSVLTTASLVASSAETTYNDTASTSGFYFARFKNSITSVFSGYSPGVAYGGFVILTARSVIDNALQMINKRTSAILTDEFAFMQIDNCQMEVIKELKRWSWMQVFNANLGQATTGGFSVALPAAVDDQNTNKSIWNFRLGRETDMTWVDKEKFDEILQGVSYTTLLNAINLNDLTITLTSSSDFNDSGTVTIGANTYAYTANNRSTGVLTIVASLTTNTAGTYVFQGAGQGNPSYWTTWGGNIYHYNIIGSTFNNRNYYLDYYKSLTQIVGETDVIVVPDPTLVQYYLAWKFILRLNDGDETTVATGYHDIYKERVVKLIQKEVLGRSFRLRPRYNDWTKQTFMENNDSKKVRDGNFKDI